VVETYQDVGICGARARRPGLDQLLKDAWHGQFQVVVVWDLSHIARSPLNALELLREFEQIKVRLIAVKQAFDTGTPLDRPFFTLATLFAELGRSILVERLRAAVERARAQGKQIGRPARIVDMAELARLEGEGLSVRQIARQIGVPRSTVAKRLRAIRSQAEPSDVATRRA